jgi:hypothetical protein
MPARDPRMVYSTPLRAPFEKSKLLGSGGSMVARLKLKGIDGRAPPGVCSSFAPVNLSLVPRYQKGWLVSRGWRHFQIAGKS